MDCAEFRVAYGNMSMGCGIEGLREIVKYNFGLPAHH